MHSFFSAIKNIYGPSNQGPTPLRPKNGGDLIKEREAVNTRRRKEHFEHLLNRENCADESVFNSTPQHPIRDKLGNLPTLDEVQEVEEQQIIWS